MGTSDIIRSLRAEIAQAALEGKELMEEVVIKGEAEIADFENATAEEVTANLQNYFEETVNPLVGNYVSKEKGIKEHRIERAAEIVKPEMRQKVVPERDAQDAASKFEKRNPELRSASLLNLLKKAKDCKTKEELLALVEDYYPDPLLADEALDFLSATTLDELKELVQEAKEDFTAKHESDIRAEKNIAQEVSRFAGQEIAERPKLRQRYLELIHTSEGRAATELFLDYSKQFPSYKEMRRIFAYFYRALGMDLKSQGPSIEKGLLHSLMQEVRKAQSGIGLYNFFRDRMSLVQKEFERNGIPLPDSFTFETMTTSFLKLISERYPSLEKVMDHLPFAKLLNILGKIVLLNQFRDALPQTSTTFLFRSEQHKEELRKSILDALERLEEELEEIEEEEWTEEDVFEFPEKRKKKQNEEEMNAEEP